MEREDRRKEESEKEAGSDTQNSPHSAVKPSDGGSASDDVVKDENIPVVYIDTTPDVPVK